MYTPDYDAANIVFSLFAVGFSFSLLCILRQEVVFDVLRRLLSNANGRLMDKLYFSISKLFKIF